MTARNLDRSSGTLSFLGGTLTVSGGVYTQTTSSGTANNVLVINGNTSATPAAFQLTAGATAVGVEAVVIGATNNGSLEISGGSVLTNTGSSVTLTTIGGTGISRGNAFLGLRAGSVGSVAVRDANSQWNLSGVMFLGFSGAGSLTIQNGGKVTANGNVSLGENAGSTGTATVSGANSQWVTNGSLYVGSAGRGVVQIENGGVLNGYLATVGSVTSASGKVTVTGADSAWNLSNALYLGNSGTGVLNVQQGARVVTPNTIYVGANTGGNGTILVGDSGSQLLAGSLIVGHYGTGTLNVQNGAQVGSSLTYIGYNASAHGEAVVSGTGSRWTTTSDFSVGASGTGILNIDAGGKVYGGTGYLGLASGTGTAAISGVGSLWAMTGDLTIGQAGTGNLLLAAGGQVQSRYGTLGNNTTGSGMAVVSGTGSQWTTTNNLFLGLNGKGILNVLDGGFVRNSGVTIGLYSTGSGTANVSGNGSVWEAGSSLQIGFDGSGALNITDGGQVRSSSGSVGYQATGRGTATIAGDGSQWTLTGGLEVGFSGTGALTIRDGGQLQSYSGQLGIVSTARSTVDIIGPNSRWSMSDALTVGSGGSSVVSVLDGGQLISRYAYVGSSTGGTGTITISGASSQWTLSNQLRVGDNGAGNVNVLNGARLQGVDAYFGYSTSGTANVTVANSEFLLASTFIIGQSGNASVTVTDGGSLVSYFGFMGRLGTGVGSAIVSGANSQWSVTDELNVGYLGTAAFQIEDGGQVFSRAATIGSRTGGVGTATIRGANSRWTVTHQFNVGGDDSSGGGTGRVTVTNGGSLVVGSTLKLWSNGTLTLDGGSVTARHFNRSLGTLTFNDGTLTVSGGAYTQATGSGAISNILTIDGNTASADPLFRLTNGATTVGVEAAVVGMTNRGELLISDGSVLTTSGSGTVLAAFNGGNVVSGGAILGRDAGSFGSAIVTGSNSRWSLNQSLVVGYFGQGSLVVDDRGSLLSDVGYLGLDDGGQGDAVISGTGSRWTLTNFLSIGESLGRGTLTIANSGSVVSNDGRIGDLSGGNGTATITGAGSQWTIANELLLAFSADSQGTLNVVDGGTLVSGNASIGYAGIGAASVVGVGSLWNATGDLMVGFDGTGTLNLSDGGAIHSQGAYLGNNVYSQGSAYLSGVGTRWTVTGDLSVGYEGTGDLTIVNGATLVSGQAYVGENGSGLITIEGADSRLETQQLQIGVAGQGYVQITSGGQLVSDAATLGVDGGSYGFVSLENEDTRWTITNDLIIGQAGGGGLELGDGASLFAGNVYLGTEEGDGYLGLYDAGTQMNVAGSLVFGQHGSASIEMYGGAQLFSQNASLGLSADYETYVELYDLDSRWTVTNDLYIGGDENGSGGTANVSIFSGATLAVGGLTKVWDPGILNVDYDGTFITGRLDGYVTNNGRLYVGDNTDWTYSQALSGDGIVYKTGAGTMSVDGLTTVAQFAALSGTFQVAANTFSTADMAIESSAAVVSKDTGFLVSQNLAINGGLGIARNGGQWYADNAAVGQGGSFRVESDGYLDVGTNLSLGAVGPASVNVGGGNARLIVHNDLYVGGDGSTAGDAASLLIESGGSVEVANTSIIWQTGSVHVNQGGRYQTGHLTVMEGGQFIVDDGGTFGGGVNTAGNYILNGKLTGDVSVSDGGTFGGSGVIVGKLSGAGLVGPGNSPGVLDAVQLNPASGIDFLFQFNVANGAPNYVDRTNSGNDVLHLTHSTLPFLSSLTSANKITIDFGLELHDGDYFLGGFFTNLLGTDFYSSISGAQFEYLVNGNPLDMGVWQFDVDTIQQPGVQFGNDYGGQVDGRVMRIEAHRTDVQAVPEPSSMILCALGAGGYYWRRRKQKQGGSANAAPSETDAPAALDQESSSNV